MFKKSELHDLQAARARAVGKLEAIVFVMLTNHEAGLGMFTSDWLRLRRSYYELEDASVAVREYCLKSELVQ